MLFDNVVKGTNWSLVLLFTDGVLHGYTSEIFQAGATAQFVKMLDGHRPQNMKLRQAGNGLRKLWDVEVVFDANGRMYLDRGRKQFVRAYDLGIGYFLVFRYDGNATFAVKVFETTMCNGRRSSEYCDRCYVYGSSDSGSKRSSDSGDSKSSSDDGLAMDVPQLGDMAMPIVVEEYIP
ncbi:B3 domain-containing protein [Hordeum vulgare]|nr:B3 domain-containing protein [Hordeum vulgare]